METGTAIALDAERKHDMRIAIPVDDNREETAVCISFGRTPWFMIQDTEGSTLEFMENAAANSPGGAGIQAAQAVVDQKADVLLTPRCGENAAEVLRAAGVRMFKTFAGTASDNVQAFLDGKLAVLEETHAGFHGQGGH